MIIKKIIAAILVIAAGFFLFYSQSYGEFPLKEKLKHADSLILRDLRNGRDTKITDSKQIQQFLDHIENVQVKKAFNQRENYSGGWSFSAKYGKTSMAFADRKIDIDGTEYDVKGKLPYDQIYQFMKEQTNHK
ncbi:hypothetical protein [Metabacillus sp. RGM 3146]|uniref:hypothetical protein n=1 Tax=Metabacillus sp. RGM 3146 TaxID=3401092 RepID=UPI003B9A5651